MDKFVFLLICTVLCAGYFKETSGQYTKYRVCATRQFTSQCQILQRGNSDVTCLYVQDSIECAQSIRNKSAHFGVFSAESTLQLAYLGWDNLVVLKELRHQERPMNSADFSAVVLIKDPTFKGGLGNLQGKNFCHPGLNYGRGQKWSELFLKHFERIVTDVNCEISKDGTVAELETLAVHRFFSTACRPGAWSNNEQEDAYLKQKYPSLCATCDQPDKCMYDSNIVGTDHRKALECLKRKGHVTYVSLQEAKQFFVENAQSINEYSYLCPNGTIQSATAQNPCVWLSQPWPSVIGNADMSVELNSALTGWVRGSSDWHGALLEILTYGNYLVKDAPNIQVPRNHFSMFREIPVENDVCGKKFSWCTTSLEEYEKCKVLRAGGISTGVQPIVECKSPSANVVQCLLDISQDKADIMGIDSNYGFIARNNFNLTAAMYAETDDQFYSKVVILLKSNSRISRFDDLRGKKACFPEFGGIASVAFIDAGRGKGLFPKNECNYGKLLSGYFGDSCAPGAKDVLHDQKFRSIVKESEKLCSLCKNQGAVPLNPLDLDTNIETLHPNNREANLRGALVEEIEDVSMKGRPKRQITINSGDHCTPSLNNRYFGTRGALQCLNEVGDVAIVELQRLSKFVDELKLNSNDYKIMCRDGTIVPADGFKVDQKCPIITMVDGEIVIKRRSPKGKDIVQALNSFDKYFNIKSDPDFKMYDKFDGIEDLLFEHSSVGLVSANATEFGPSVKNYIRLFENTDACVAKKSSAVSVAISIVLLSICTIFIVFM